MTSSDIFGMVTMVTLGAVICVAAICVTIYNLGVAICVG